MQITRMPAMAGVHTQTPRSTKWICRGPRVIMIMFHPTAEHMAEDIAHKQPFFAGPLFRRARFVTVLFSSSRRFGRRPIPGRVVAEFVQFAWFYSVFHQHPVDNFRRQARVACC